MAVRERRGTYYVTFRWNNHRMDTATPAASMVEARRIEKAIRTAFSIGRFDHLEPNALDVVVRTFREQGLGSSSRDIGLRAGARRLPCCRQLKITLMMINLEPVPEELVRRRTPAKTLQG